MARDYAAVIAGLLAHAENEANTDAARQTYRNKAEEMMREYRVAEEDALATDPGSVSPVLKTMTGVTASGLAGHYFPAILRLLAEHAEVQVHVVHTWSGDRRVLVPNVVGYEGDVRYFEFLWTATHLMFATRITPTWDATRPEADNIFFMRQAGIGRKEIANHAWGHNAGDEAKNRSKVQRIYLGEAARRGEPTLATGLGFNSKLYRDAYANQFYTTLHTRLWMARQAANAANGQVVMAGRAQRVLDALYNHFPKLRPSDNDTVTEYRDPTLDCDRCQKAKSGFCRAHDYLRPRDATQADRARWDRQANSTSARAGQSAGSSAAQGVHIQRGAETGKVTGGTTREIG